MTIHNLILEWQGITIDIKHNDEWSTFPDLDYYVHHIEIKRRDEGQLPMSETGYRSHFISGTGKEDALEPYGSAINLVQAWLDEVGQSKRWKTYVESQRQLSLF